MARARLTAAVAVLLAVSPTTGQDFRLPWASVNSGGRPGASQSHGLNLGVGQPVQGAGVSENHKGFWGFWYFSDSPTDVGVKAITSPPSYVPVNTSVTPRALCRNYSATMEADFSVCFKLRKPTGEWVYEREQPVTGLAPGGETEVEFPAYSVGTEEGNWQAYCSTYAAGDSNRANNVCVKTFRVSSLPNWPFGWTEVRPMPHIGGERPVKDGGWLAAGPAAHGSQLTAGRPESEAVSGKLSAVGCLYVAKGNKTPDFFRYDPVDGSWLARRGIPEIEGAVAKPPSKGCVGVSDGGNHIYMTKGNNTIGFWRYEIDGDSWQKMPDVPLGFERKKVKGGTDMVYVPGGLDTGWVYLLKGYKTEFYRFNTLTETWDLSLPLAPAGGGKARYNKGSFLVYDGERFIYAHQATYYNRNTGCHHMFRYDIEAGRWTDTLKGMPLLGWHNGKPGKNKKSKDGGAGAWFRGRLYAVKGGNTQQFFRYFPPRDSWQELDTVPGNGSTGKKKYVKQGADFASYGGGAFFLLKGNKTFELWRYVANGELRTPNSELSRTGVMAETFDVRRSTFIVSPNPIVSGFATLRFSLPKAGPVTLTVLDVAGRSVFRRTTTGLRTSTITVDLRKLSSGVYLVRLDAGNHTATQKLVVQR